MKLSSSNTNANIAIYSGNNILSSSLIDSNSISIQSIKIISNSSLNVGSVSVNSSVISTPSLIVGVDPFYSAGLLSGIVNAQFFTANGTWTKPSGLTGNETVFIMMWGGGGGGTAGMAGGGGACSVSTQLLSSLTSTCAVTVGSAGAGGATLGTGGGSSIFVTNATTTITAYGGNFANATIAGGGGGIFGGGAVGGVGGAPLGGTASSVDSTYGGGGADGASKGGWSIFGGGGGGGGKASRGGSSIYGGGGGATSSGSSVGSSVLGGQGGNSTSNLPTSPGGGGGGVTPAGQAGARGEVRVWILNAPTPPTSSLNYAIIPDTTTLYKGSSANLTVMTTNVADGTTLYYSLNNSSTATAADFTSATVGTAVISSNKAIITITAGSTVGAKTFYFDLKTGSNTGPIVANTTTVTIPVALGKSYTFNGLVQANSDYYDVSSYVFRDVAIGTPQNDRVVVVALMAYEYGYSSYPSTVTINGSLASVAIGSQYSSPTYHYEDKLFYATVPSGQTANIEVAFPDGYYFYGDMAIATYSLYGLTSSTPNQKANNTISITYSTVINDIIIAVGENAITGIPLDATTTRVYYNSNVHSTKVSSGSSLTVASPGDQFYWTSALWR